MPDDRWGSYCAEAKIREASPDPFFYLLYRRLLSE